MNSRSREATLDHLLELYAADNPEWPDSPEDLDEFLRDCGELSVAAEVSQTRAARVISDSPGPCAAGTADSTQQDRQLMFWETSSLDCDAPAGHGSSPSLSLVDIVREAYVSVHGGYSIDRLIADPDKNCLFIQACWKLGAPAMSQLELNQLLLNARKAGDIGRVEGVQPYSVPRALMDNYLFASEVALRLLQDQEFYRAQRSVSFDRILCDPKLGARYVELAEMIAPGFKPVDYRWAAFCIRKWRRRPIPRTLRERPSFVTLGRRDSIRPSRIESGPGFYWLKSQSDNFYIGHVENLREHIDRLLDLNVGWLLKESSTHTLFDRGPIEYSVAPFPDTSPSGRDSLNGQLVRDCQPRMNIALVGDHAA